MDERYRRYIKDSLISLSTMTDFSRYQAGNMIKSLLSGRRERKNLHAKMVSFHAQIRKIKQRFKEHFYVKTAQINFVLDLMNREKSRMEVACLKTGDPEFRSFLYYLNRLPEKTMIKIASNWYAACAIAHEPLFFAWRNKIKKF